MDEKEEETGITQSDAECHPNFLFTRILSRLLPKIENPTPLSITYHNHSHMRNMSI